MLSRPFFLRPSGPAVGATRGRTIPAMLPVVDLGLLAYAPAYQRQTEEMERVLVARDAAGESGGTDAGVLLLVEHPPVVTVSRRPGAAGNVIAPESLLRARGVDVHPTDRGGDVTYHGPGQLVAYPILDLNRLNLGLHAYMRLLEEAVIRTCTEFGVATVRDAGATGVWTRVEREDGQSGPGAKIAAMGVRVRRWVSMHGLAINVDPDLSHFALIVPCGLHGRAVTSLRRELGARCPSMDQVKRVLTDRLTELVAEAEGAARTARA